MNDNDVTERHWVWGLICRVLGRKALEAVVGVGEVHISLMGQAAQADDCFTITPTAETGMSPHLQRPRIVYTTAAVVPEAAHVRRTGSS